MNEKIEILNKFNLWHSNAFELGFWRDYYTKQLFNAI